MLYTEENEGIDELKRLLTIVSNHKIQYALKRLLMFKEHLYSTSKFKVGDRVILADTPIINNDVSWGWLAYKNLLVKGATATVSEVDFRGYFAYGLCFDNDPEKRQFWFKETSIKKRKSP